MKRQELAASTDRRSRRGAPRHQCCCLPLLLQGAFSLQGQLPPVEPNVKLIKGLFDATLDKFLTEHPAQEIAWLHVDSDLFSSAKIIFDRVHSRLADGAIVLFDELVNYDGYEAGEMLSLFEMLLATKATVRVIGMHGPLAVEHPPPQYGNWLRESAAFYYVKPRASGGGWSHPSSQAKPTTG